MGAVRNPGEGKRRRKARMLFLAFLSAIFLVSGCQTTGDGRDRPILPLIPPLAVSSVVRVGRLGAPVAAARTNEIHDDSNSPTHILLVGKKNDVIDEITQSAKSLSCFPDEVVIDLDRAFQIANVANPQIGLGEELIQAQLAERMLARSMLFPTLNLGTTLTIHRGPLLAASGTVRDVDRESLYFGAGASVRGAGTVSIPGVRVVSHLGDAVFAPRIAEEKVRRSQFESAATQNNVLLDVARAYLSLVSAESRLLALRQSESELAELAKLTANFAAKGAGREADALRTQSELALLRASIYRVEEEAIARATELARLLSADSAVRMRPEPGIPPLVQLIDDRASLDSLLESAINNRPEVASSNVEVAIQQTRLRQERMRPFLPTVSIGFSAGDFGGGSNLAGYRLSNFNSRTDLDIAAVWSLQNLGIGNRALQNEARAQIGIAEARRIHAIDLVRREVTEVHARIRVARNRIDIAKRRLETSQQAYRQDFLRTKDQLGRLVEVLSSFNMLAAARQELIQAMVGYSLSQFELHVALGGTPANTHIGEAEKR